MLSSIVKLVNKIWDNWNIRIVILFSLFLQIVLIFSAPSRKRTRSFFVFFIWLAYLLADWAASYCIGLISRNEAGKNILMAFWATFLLIHLGGPDTISAFALEDNELWLRHLVALIFQSITVGYVFFLTLRGNTLLLWLPTILTFLTGLIKYSERIHALYVAAINNFRKSLLPDPDAGPNYAKLMEEHSSRQEAGIPAEIIVITELRQRSDDNNYADQNDGDRVVGNEDPIEFVQKAFFLFHMFQGLIVDMIYSFKDRTESQKHFQNKKAEEALRLIEIELNFMYEVFYTKASVVRQYWIWFLGKYVSLILMTATLVLFIKAERHNTNFNQSDVKTTYALIYGALVLDVMALFMRYFTDYTAALSDESLLDSYTAPFYQKIRLCLFKCLNKRLLSHFLGWRIPTWSTIKQGRPYEGCEKLSTNFFFRRWCGSISGHNLLKYSLDESIRRVPSNVHPNFYVAQVIQLYFRIVVCLQDFFYQRDKRFVFKDVLDQWRYKFENPFLKELWQYIFEKIKEKSEEAKDIEAIQSICSARGERVVQKGNNDLKNLKPFVDPNEVAFDQSLLLWHIATALCYTKDSTSEVDQRHKKREISMILSDYMLYLLIMQPNMMSAIAGIGQKRFQDTCEEVKKFFRKRIAAKGDRKALLKVACDSLIKVPTEQKPIDVKGDRSKSLLFDACRLHKELEKSEYEVKWEVITNVWVELLSYAACHCRPTGHVQLLSKGGELISFVWLLMVQLGLSTQFQIEDGDAMTKLIVGFTPSPMLLFSSNRARLLVSAVSHCTKDQQQAPLFSGI